MPACTGRQVLGHYAVRALAGSLGLTNLEAIVSPLNEVLESLTGGGGLVLHEQVGEVRIEWVARTDGSLPLQGYLQVVLRFVDPAIAIDVRTFLGVVDAVDIADARVRILLSPYFYATPSPLGACDTCRRRVPDMTLHWVVTSAELLADSDDATGPPSVDGCSCGPVEVADCYLDRCDPQSIGDREIHDTAAIPGALDEQLKKAVEAREQLETLDLLLYSLTSDPVIGGVLLGRREAVADVVDGAMCLPAPAMDGPPVPERLEPACAPGAPDMTREVGRIFVADTLELLRIGSGRAALLGRDNGPGPSP